VGLDRSHSRTAFLVCSTVLSKLRPCDGLIPRSRSPAKRVKKLKNLQKTKPSRNCKCLKEVSKLQDELNKISGSHDSEYKDDCILGCCVV
jgi:hypothetical protein